MNPKKNRKPTKTDRSESFTTAIQPQPGVTTIIYTIHWKKGNIIEATAKTAKPERQIQIARKKSKLTTKDNNENLKNYLTDYLGR
ncbi:MAG: hypothetical protein LE169_00170 [Endomicrobium sp.]|nr:hypothetical protein [Endomicrobium sp.]